MMQKLVPIGILVFAVAVATVPAAPADKAAALDSLLDRELPDSDAAELDGLERALGAETMIERMEAVQSLGARAGSGESSPRVVALLRAATGDADPDVSHQAQVELARLEGVDLIPAAVREEHRLALALEELAAVEADLGSPDALARLQAVQRLPLMRGSSVGETRFRALLTTARLDADPDVAYQASVELARLDGVDLITAEVRAAHRLSLERREVDHLEAALGSEEMIERMQAVQRLAGLLLGAAEPELPVSLLRAAAGDLDLDVAEQAWVALARWDARQAD